MNESRRLASPVDLTPSWPPIEQDEVDLSGTMRTVWRGKWTILLVTLIALALGAYYLQVVGPRYTAKAVVALEDRAEQVVDLQSVVSSLSGDQASINTEIEVMRSRGLINQLVRDLNLLEDPEFNPTLTEAGLLSIAGIKSLLFGRPELTLSEQEVFDTTVDEVLAAIRVTNLRQSYVFEIWLETSSPQKSMRVANALADLYIMDQLKLKFEATEKATSWLSERVSSLKTELETAETKLKNFTASTKLVSSEWLGGLGLQLKELRERLADQTAAAGATETRLERLESALGSASPAELAVLAEDSTLERLAEGVEDGAVSRAAFDARIEEEIDRSRTGLQRDRRQVEVLESSIADLEDRIERQGGELVTLQQLEREVEATALIYESFLSRLKELSVQQGIQQPDARILSEAVLRREPSAPREGQVLALSGVLGLFLGAGLVLLRERMQSVFRTAEALERATGLPVLGQVPQAPTGRRQKLLQHVIEKPGSAFSEAVRNLRTSILLCDVDHPPNVIMVTSSVPDEGKTTQSLSLAQNLSLMGKKVLLIEADIRRRTFTDYFDVSEKDPGLVAAVTGDAPLSEIVMQSEQLGMDILLGEKSRVNAADFFSSQAFAEFIRVARENYQFVLLDTPPVLAVPDARVIGQHADAIVYVVRWDHTAKGQVASGLRLLQTLKLPVSGLVLSQIDPKGMKRYGHGASYGVHGGGYYET